MGYEFEMLTLFEYYATAQKLFNSLVEYNPKLTREKFDTVLYLVAKIVVDMDWLGNLKRINGAFEIHRGEFEMKYREYLHEIANVATIETATQIGNKYRHAFEIVGLNKPLRPIRIGLVGDLYSVIEPHGNCELVKWLLNNRVEVVSKIDLTYLSTSLFDVNALIQKSGGYVTYAIGGNANNSVALAYEYAREGIDGIIHVKASTCTPEITAMTILQNISNDFGTPIMYLTFDTETGEAGLHTRLEAFLDMVTMKREDNAHE
jgi:predicted nucleotide-binding protein (sugar kinase/HSP70/actin superfamily)